MPDSTTEIRAALAKLAIDEVEVLFALAQLRPASRVPELFGTDVPPRNGVTQRVSHPVCAQRLRDYGDFV